MDPFISLVYCYQSALLSEKAFVSPPLWDWDQKGLGMGAGSGSVLETCDSEQCIKINGNCQ